MAPKKKSMMARQRQLRAQQQQVKRASSSKLPPGKKGGAVTKPQAAKLKTTPKPSPVEKVRVRDLGPTKPKLSGTSQRALPPGTKGGSLARGGAAKGGGLAKAGGAAAKAGGLAQRLGRAGLHTAVFMEGLTARNTADGTLDAAKKRGDLAKQKPQAKPANVADYKDGQGNTYDGNSGRLKTAAKPKAPAAPPKAPAAPSASRPASPASKTGSSGGGGTSKIHTYKGHGSDLHVGRHKTLAEHRAAVEKAKGGGSASKTARKYNTPDEKSKYVAPNGKPYAGPGYGTPNKKKLKAK